LKAVWGQPHVGSNPTPAVMDRRVCCPHRRRARRGGELLPRFPPSRSASPRLAQAARRDSRIGTGIPCLLPVCCHEAENQSSHRRGHPVVVGGVIPVVFRCLRWFVPCPFHVSGFLPTSASGEPFAPIPEVLRQPNETAPSLAACTRSEEDVRGRPHQRCEGSRTRERGCGRRDTGNSARDRSRELGRRAEGARGNRRVACESSDVLPRRPYPLPRGDR
jgi:hypothetical protein